jgi:hypothetical protein
MMIQSPTTWLGSLIIPLPPIQPFCLLPGGFLAPCHGVVNLDAATVLCHALGCGETTASTAKRLRCILELLRPSGSTKDKRVGYHTYTAMSDILGVSGSDVDERTVAKAALEAAEEQLRSLCASHAGTFVSVERRGHALESSLKDLLASVQDVESQISNAQHALEQEEESESSLAALSEKHRVRRRTLLQHSSLLELLELPSLMDACVRSNLYEEALSIAAFANTLERRHTEKNEVVLKVIAQVRSRQSDLRRHLLHCLKGYVTMPECLEIVTALRRLNSIDLERQSETNLERVHSAMELSLQVDFLEARDAWLDQPADSTSLPGVGRSKIPVHSSEQLLDTIERYRTR